MGAPGARVDPASSPVNGTPRRSPNPRGLFSIVRLCTSPAVLGPLLAFMSLLVTVSPALAQDEAARITKMNKQALDAFDNLNFEQAKTLLEQALSTAESGSLGEDAVTARTHLNLGMVLIAGFQKRDEAVEHFRAALKIQPEIAPARGLFNPEVQAVFDEVKAEAKAPKKPPEEDQGAVAQAGEGDKEDEDDEEKARAARRKEEDDTGDDDDDDDDGSLPVAAPYFLGVGIGTGGGVTRGHFQTERDLCVIDGTTCTPTELGSGKFAFAQLSAEGGYFISTSFLLSLEARLQLVSSGSLTCGDQGAGGESGCTTGAGVGFAALAKGTYFLTAQGLRPFLTLGFGFGTKAKQAVKLNGLMTCAYGSDPTGNKQCYDTVTAGPVMAVGGGGVAYELGSLVLMATAAANAAFPDLMLNMQLVLGMGFRL
jgi:hypothetical protein